MESNTFDFPPMRMVELLAKASSNLDTSNVQLLRGSSTSPASNPACKAVEIGAVSADEAEAVTSLSLGIVFCRVADERRVLKTLLCHIPSAFIQPRINKVEDCAGSNAGTANRCVYIISL